MLGNYLLSLLRFFRLALIASLIIASCCLADTPVNDKHEKSGYTLGMFPFLPPARLEQSYGFFARALSQALGRPITFQTKPTFDAFSNAIDAQIYDIVLMQPFDYVETGSRVGYLPAARVAELLTAIIVVDNNSKLKGLAELKGKVIAMPPPAAAVHRLALAALAEISLHPPLDFTLKNYRTHYSCIQSVIIGDADACVTNSLPIRVFKSKSGKSLRVLAETRGIPHVLFAAHKRLSVLDRDLIRSTIVDLAKMPAYRHLLVESGFSNGFIAASDDEYDIIRSLSSAPENK